MQVLPPLPYSYDALEPYLDARTIEVHYDKHHRGYVNKFNKAVEGYPELQKKPIEQVLKDLSTVPEKIRIAVRNFGGGVYNHTLYWNSMKKNASSFVSASAAYYGGQERYTELAQAIEKSFGSFDDFQKQFSACAQMLFGSGWVWLCVDKSGHLSLVSTVNQDCPLSGGLTPIMCLDVWEHAYYLKYQNKRPDYIIACWHVIDWEAVANRYRAAL